MQKRERVKLSRKAVGLICAVVLLVTALWVPMSFSASAAEAMTVTADETTVFGFEDSIPSSTTAENKAEFDATGVGYCGWSGGTSNATDDETNKVLWFGRPQQQEWATHGAYRLNKKVGDTYQVYNLEPNTTYVVSMKVRVISSSVFTDEEKTAYECYVSLGYGTKFNTNDTNYASTIDKTLVKIVSTKAESGVYTLDTGVGTKDLPCGNDWQEVVYQFTTPADLGSFDHGLALFGMARTGFRTEIDDLAVTKLSENKGVAILIDEYSDKTEVVFGEIGTELTLPDVSDRAQQADHSFNGWYSDAERTEKIEKLTYSKEKQVAYTGWAAPVTVTFKDTLNNTEKTLTGMAGESFTYPADPTDANGEQWFMGWYTSEAYTEEHTSGKFGFANATLYAYWKSEVPGLVQDFEEYPYCKKEVHDAVDSTTGVTYKKYKDNLIIGNTMTLQGDVTASADSKTAVKFVWDSTKQRDFAKGIGVDDPTSYNAATRYHEYDNYMWLGTGLENNQAYIISFKVRVEKAESDLEFYALSAAFNNGWGNYVRYQPGYKTYEVSENWQTVSFQITTNYKTETAKYMYLGVRMKENKDVVLYFDDVEIKAVAQPYESIVFVNNGYNGEVITVMGKRGEALNLPVLTHPSDAEFEGWFTDSNCTEKLDITTFPRKNINVYAKWGVATIKFRNDYPFRTDDTLRFGKLFSIVNEKGIGKDDDYAIRWDFVGNEPYNAQGALWASRGAQFDSVFTVATKLKDGALYRITYDYMATSKTNVKVSITPTSCGEANIWWNNVRYVYDSAGVTIPEGGCDWQSAEVYISANVLKTDSLTGDALFFLLRTANNDEANVADVRIDNIRVEEVVAPYVFFDCQNSENTYMIEGTVGEEIKYPANPTRFGHTFKGWYKDIECTEKFDLKVFEDDTEATAYAGWTPASTVTYSFEKYDLVNGGGIYAYTDCEVEKGTVKSGKQALHFGNRTEGNYNSGASFAAIAQGKEIFTLERGYQYVVTVNYNAKKVGNGNLLLAFVASNTNFWAGQNNGVIVAPDLTVLATAAKQNEGKWMNKTFVVDTSIIDEKITDPAQKDKYTYLYLRVKGAQEWDIWFDDITITKVPKGKTAVCIDNEGVSQIPTHLIGNVGASYSSKLPDAKVDGKYFKGYYTKDAQGAYTELKREDMVFQKEAITIYARFLDYEVKEDFEGDYLEKGESYAQSYTTYDFDYEIYDATKEGNSKDNVTNGNFSLHRKGDSMYFENAVILTLGNQIAEGERYTVSFKVKLGENTKQTDGAIKVVSGRSFRYAWTTTGDYYAVVPIKDLLDGQWHEVSYTFNSVEAFACIQTPGYCELFMDEFKFSIAGDAAPLSNPVAYTEYVPAKRDAEGNLVDKDDEAVDVTSIIDISLYTGDNSLIWIIVAAAAVLILGGGVLAFILIKKKKQAKS